MIINTGSNGKDAVHFSDFTSYDFCLAQTTRHERISISSLECKKSNSEYSVLVLHDEDNGNVVYGFTQTLFDRMFEIVQSVDVATHLISLRYTVGYLGRGNDDDRRDDSSGLADEFTFNIRSREPGGGLKTIRVGVNDQ